MLIEITFRHLEHTPALDELIRHKLERLSKFFGEQARLHCSSWVESQNHVCTLSIHDHHHDYYVKAESSDLYKTIDMAIHKLDRQIQANLPDQRLHTVTP